MFSQLLTWGPELLRSHPGVGTSIAVALFIVTPLAVLVFGLRYRKRP